MFSKKIKTLLCLGSGLIGVTSIVTPLCCGCSNSDERTKNDRIYNIDERQYQHIEGQYHDVVEAKIRKEGKDTKTPEEIQKEVKEANDRITQQLASFREQKEKQNATFTEVTDAIIDTASNDFGVSLSRNLGDVNWNVENSKVEQEYANLLRNNLNKEGVLTPEEVNQQLKSFHNKFGALSTRLGKEYTDPLRAQNELKAQIATCFEDANNDMALLAATTVNRNFFKDYNFQLREKTKQGQKIYWDELQKDKETFKVDPNGKENLAFTTWVNENYECTNVKTKKTWEFNLLDENNNLISNYHIAPIFKGFAKEPLTNTYTIKVDWTFIKNDNYAKTKTDPTLATKVTGHSFTLTNKDRVHKDLNYVEDVIKAPDSDKKFNEYPLLATLTEEKRSIKEAYLDKIDFKWAPKEQCKYEKFFCAMKLDEEHPKGLLNTEQLGEVGLTLGLKSDHKFVSLKDLLIDTPKIAPEKWTLLNHFVNNCDIQSNSIVENDAKHIVDNTFYASYKSSTYSMNRKNECNRWETIGNFRAEGFPISREIWVSAKKDFDKARDIVNKIDKNVFKKPKATAIVLQTLLFCFATIITTLMIETIGFFKIAVTIVLGVLAGLALAAAAAYIPLGLAPICEWYDKCEQPRNSPEFLIVKVDLEVDLNNLFCDENTFRNAPWLSVIRKMNKYQNFKNSENMKKFYDAFKDFFDYDKYNKEIVTKFKNFMTANACCFFTSVGLVVTTLLVAGASKEKKVIEVSADQMAKQTYENGSMLAHSGMWREFNYAPHGWARIREWWNNIRNQRIIDVFLQ